MIIVILALTVTMSSSNSIILIVALMLSAITIIVISQESCNVCNCQFNDVQVLDQLIATKVNAAITSKLLIRVDNYYYKNVHVIITIMFSISLL